MDRQGFEVEIATKEKEVSFFYYNRAMLPYVSNNSLNFGKNISGMFWLIYLLLLIKIWRLDTDVTGVTNQDLYMAL